MHVFTSIAQHPVATFAMSVLLACLSMVLILWIDNAVQLADSLQMLNLFALFGE